MSILVPNGVTLIWDSTNSTIPAQWTRETVLDGRYPKGHGSENPNTNGGSNTHTHTGSHTHTLTAHTHTFSSGYAEETSLQQCSNNPEGNTSKHTHATHVINATAGGGLQSTSTSWQSSNNEPPNRTVIFIKPNGSPAPLVSGIHAYTNNSTLPGNWYLCDGNNGTNDHRNKYHKGASAGSDAGSTGGATTHSHTLDHTHTVTAHTHSGYMSGIGSWYGGRGKADNPTGAFVLSNHIHVVNFAATSDSIYGYTGTGGSSDAVEPAYKKISVIKNTTDDNLQLGVIGLWLNTVVSIPDNWRVCDGTYGTPDLRDYFIKIASTVTEHGNTGGSNTHTHTAVSHSHTATGTHTHVGSHQSAPDYRSNPGGTNDGVCYYDHVHSIDNESFSTSTFSSDNISADTVSNQPAYTTVAYIRYSVTADIQNANFAKASIVRTEASSSVVKASIRTAIAWNYTKGDVIRFNEKLENSAKANCYWIISKNSSTKADILNTYFNSNSVIAQISSHAFNKFYEYRVYDNTGAFITNWTDEVISEPSFKMVINGGPGEMVVKLARSFDSFGEDVDISLFNRVECHCFDRDSVNGVLLYTGYISGYRPVLEGSSEYVEVTLLHYISEMTNIFLRDGSGDTDIPMNSTDPSDMFKNIVNYYRADGGAIFYTNDSIDNTGTVATYDFQTCNTKEAIDKAIELTPMYWYWYVDADNTLYMKYSDLLTAQHSFVVGRHIVKMETWRRGEDIVNRVYFVGADSGGVAMYRVYSSTASITTYGIHSEKIVDQRVTLSATADIMANRVINRKKDPEIRTTITIMDNNGFDSRKGYDIESIKPGQTMRIKNLKQGVKTVTRWDQFMWDEDVWDQTLSYAAADNIQIQSVEYHPDYVVIEASSRLPDISKRVEDVYRNIEETQTLTTPGTPTAG